MIQTTTKLLMYGNDGLYTAFALSRSSFSSEKMSRVAFASYARSSCVQLTMSEWFDAKVDSSSCNVHSHADPSPDYIRHLYPSLTLFSALPPHRSCHPTQIRPLAHIQDRTKSPRRLSKSLKNSWMMDSISATPSILDRVA